MKIFGQIEEVSLEQLSTDPVSSTQGRIFQNTTEGRTKLDDGTFKRALFRNDGKIIVGNDAAPAKNVRVHKAGDEVLQTVLGNDVTAEGSSSNSLGQLGTRVENIVNASLPTAANTGRLSYITDQETIGVDDGANWRRVIPEFVSSDATSGATIELAAVTSSLVRLTGSFTTLSTIPAGFKGQRVTLINRTGADVSVSHDSGATPANRIYTGTGANLVFKSNSALTLWYDDVTLRWQVAGETAGAAAGGGALPNSSLVIATADYTVLITDDILLADATNGPINLTLPSAVGNLGKKLYFEKISGSVRNIVTVIGTINGIANEEMRDLNAPFEIVSDGSVWKAISKPSGELFFSRPIGEYVTVAAVSTANVALETLSAAALSVVDNVLLKTGNRILLKNQSAPEENGIYLVPAANITIAATAVANHDISLLANGSVVNVTVVSTGQKVSLRFQTVPAENGIYVIGATPGTTVRDTSLLDPSYVAPASLKTLIVFADWYNHTTLAATAPTENAPTHTNDRLFWRQTNENMTTFTDAAFSSANETITVKIPVNASAAMIEICPFGGAGAAGWPSVRGGGGGCGAIPFTFTKRVTAGGNLTITLPLGAIPGTGRTTALSIGGNGPTITVAGVSPDVAFSIPVVGGTGGTNAGTETVTVFSGARYPGLTTAAPIPLKGGPLFTNGGRYQLVGESSFFSAGGAAGVSGGALAGGGGGGGQDGVGGAGTSGANSAGFYSLPGGAGTSYGCGGGASGAAPASGRPGRGGFSGPGFVRIIWL